MIVELDGQQADAVRCALEVRVGHLSWRLPRTDDVRLRRQLDEERAVLRVLLRDLADAQRRQCT